MVLNNFIKAACLSTCLGLASGSLLANESNVETSGGLKVYDTANTDHWFRLNGSIKFDQNLFHTQNINEMVSATNLRGVQATLSGGIGNNTSYKLKLTNGKDGLSVDNASISYSGFNNWSKVSIGNIRAPYGLEGASDSSFLEKSIASTVFSAGSGLGVNFNAWTDKVGLALSVMQPGENLTARDQVSVATRLAFAPVNTENLVFHLGLSARYEAATIVEEEFGPQVRFSTNLEVRGRNSHKMLETGPVTATSFNVVGVDAALQRGPALFQAEYHHANVNKTKSTDTFIHGWNVQASYAITGEKRSYNYKDGGFNNPSSVVGGWEVSLRHSFVNLNKNDIAGGTAHTFGGSVAWTASENLRILANYIHSPVTPPMPLNGEQITHNLGAFAVRVQASW